MSLTLIWGKRGSEKNAKTPGRWRRRNVSGRRRKRQVLVRTVDFENITVLVLIL